MSQLHFDGLQSGDYLLCITSDDVPGFEQCFTVSILEPAPLAVSANVNALASMVTLDLSGSKEYIIGLNELVFEANNVSQKTLPLDQRAECGHGQDSFELSRGVQRIDLYR